MDNYVEVLRNEFEAGDGSFLIKLRPDLDWDKEAFSRLVVAMQLYCEKHAGSETLERWVAFGFWYIPRFVRDWTTHPNFPHQYPDNYYEQAYQRLDDLAYWYFMGESPYLDGAGFGPI